MPTARGGGVAAVIDDKIYVAGGRPPRGHDFAVYDPADDTWTTLPDIPTDRNHTAAAAIDGKMYVVGGRFGAGFCSEMTNVLEVYDPAANSWSSLAPMPTVRGGLNALAANGCLHVFGGEGPNGIFAQHEVYDPTADTWFSLEDMPTPVHGVTGDANLDGAFNTGDQVQVFQAGKFETAAAASWGEGDWNGDQRFGSADLLKAFQDGGFESGPRTLAATVPEPASFLISIGFALVAIHRIRRI